ncbi:Uma2 family endonuclease [Chroococcidiopsis sp. FACHB-1243]|uniref:Uma2 family endonuclease n=1 Tax=Chroococcidiopsis sp. [FACHB-1243] TaxID=2692781 RepID=UPI001786B949|nr:Uma2 family endonuclease [Chroococcidiopsis sp. [FACHB-1243]]MBD2307587.1 Uma2 family endonuclease [Chroococcidiopsis sp. [FACHB-1243]]
MFTTNETVNSPPIETLLAEKRVAFYHIDWRSYEKILEALGERRAARITYYQGTLEIVTPLEEHESAHDRLGILIHILTEELNLNIKSMASTTLKIPTLKIGAEPDKCYYIQNEPAVRGKRVDLSIDPPPDLILEVDITHTDINKNQLYQEMQVPEFWRYNGKILTIYLLERDRYRESETSPTFPSLTKSIIYEFLAQCHTQGEAQTKRAFRAKLREQFMTQEDS